MRVSLVVASLMAGCSFAPPLQVPDVPTAANYKEAAPWTVAEPADHLPRDAWWTLYRDPELDALQGRLVDGSPDLAAAFARYAQAIAIADQARAGLVPALGLGGNVQRDRQSATRPLRGSAANTYYNSLTVAGQFDYEFDLWGRVRNTVAANDAAAAASQGDLESARLSLEAQLADDYLNLRGIDQTVALLKDTVTAYQKALDLTKQRHEGGIVSGIDVARAQTQLDSTRSLVEQEIAQRALVEHAIAALVGESPSTFSIAARTDDIPLPPIPTGVPSLLLQRRPDIAAAERRVASANASIGVAKAAYFPSLTLSAQGGYQTANVGNFITAPNAFWAVGPSLFFAIFDGGRRRAEVRRTEAVLDENSARYRGVVIGAFQQVEDNLALLEHYRQAAISDRSALDAAQKTLDFATTRYREGAVNYLEVVTAQTALLQTQRTALDLDTAQRRASVQLIRALGGGWNGPLEVPVASR